MGLGWVLASYLIEEKPEVGRRDLLTCLRYELLVNFSDEWAVQSQEQRERERGGDNRN